MKTIVVLFSFSIILNTASSDLFINQKEMQVALSILEHLNIHDCTFVSETLNITDPYPLASQIKRLSSLNLSASFWTLHSFVAWVQMNKLMYHKKAFIIKRLGLIQDFIMYNDLNGMLYKYIWLVFDNDIKLFIPYDCEFISVQKMDENTYKLTEMYNTKDQGFVHNFGMWDTSSGLKLSNSTLYWRRLNLNGSEIKSVALDQFEPDKCQDFDQNYECKIYEIFADFAKIQNFRNILTVYNDPHAALTSGADVALMAHVWNYEGNLITNKVGPIFQQLYNWYIKYPSTTLRPDYYLQPFEQNTWFVIIFFLIFGTGLVIFQKLVKHKKFPIGTVFTVFEIFCNQNGEESEEISLRIVFLTLNVIGYVIVNSFGAVISAFLSVEIPIIPFNDLEGFVKNGQYKLLLTERGVLLGHLSVNSCFTIRSGGLELYCPSSLQQSQHPLHQLTINNFTVQSKLNISTQSYVSEDDHVERYKKICSDGYLATESYNTKSKNRTYLKFPCAVHQITEPICKFWIGFILAEDSPFWESFNINWLRFVEYGIKDRMKRDVHYSELETAEEEEFEPVDIQQMTHVLSITLIGVISALLIFTLEFFCKNARQKNIKFNSFLKLNNRPTNLTATSKEL